MEYYGEEIGTIVVDVGRTHFKAGFAGDSSPSSFNVSAAGISNIKSEKFAGKNLDYVLSEKEIDKLQIVKPFYDLKNANFDAIEAIFNEALLEDLQIKPKEHPILVSERTDTPKIYREKLAQLLFEKMGFECLFFAKQPVLSCFASGRYTGMVLDVSGADTKCVPVSDGYSLPAETKTSEIGGDWIDTFLKTRLLARGINLIEDKILLSADKSVVDYVESRTLRDIKENFCFVKSEENGPVRSDSKDYKLPDGRLVEIKGEDRYIPTEVFFQPQSDLFEKRLNNVKSAPKLLVETLLECDADLRKNLVGNIIVSGKGLLFKGFYKRLFSSVNQMLPPALNKLKIIMPSDNIRRNFEVAWIGGSILGSIAAFKQLIVTKSEFEESGTSIIHEKCP
ncbi:hypothetical protein MHBO_000200 [Bonamia ostreae]|uniref:Uncharacterized protein n=1 Tax=Bonamia ostreae TaxID=126728 RepID=A0ABV2AER7_9EUKA